MKKGLLSLILVMFVITLPTKLWAADVNIKVYPTKEQKITGFGAACCDGAIKPYGDDTQPVSLLYGTESKIGLNIMRMEISPHFASQADGWGDYDWNGSLPSAKIVKQRGGIVFGTPWSPPADYKTNGSILGGKSDDQGNVEGKLREDCYDKFFPWLNSFLEWMHNNGVDVDAVSIQNEPDWWVSYSGCLYDPEDQVNLVKNYAHMLDRETYKGVRLISAEPLAFNPTYSNMLLRDSTTRKHIDIIAGHLYGDPPLNNMKSAATLARQYDKEVWMTEHSVSDNIGNRLPNWHEQLLFAEELNESMLAGCTAYIYWSMRAPWAFVGTGDSQYGTENKENELLPRAFVMSHFSKHLTGSTRLTTSEDMTSGSEAASEFSAYIKGDSLIVIAIDTTGVAKNIQITLPYKVKSGMRYLSTSNESLYQKEAIAIAEPIDELTLDIPAGSLSTFIFQIGHEPYAVLDGTTLTFYYDDQKEARGGMDVGPFTVPGDRRWESVAASVTTVKFDESMANCTSLTSTAYWFYGFQTLTTVTGIGNLKTDNVTDMQYMFHDCNVLTSIDVTGFNTTNVTNMRGMFYKCQQLQSIDLSSFNTALVTDMSWMFYGCNALTKIYAGSEWTAEGVVTDEDNAMFMNCTKLVGGAGTTYDETHADHTYAHIDGGPNSQTPGYFTAKSTASNLEIFSVDKTVTYVPNQSITPTPSITMTPGNDAEWLTDLAIGLTNTTTGESDDPLQFTASIYYPNSTETFSFLDALRGTLNPKDGDLTTNSETGEVTNSGKVYNPSDKNLPKSGAYIIYEALQNGSLIIPIRVTADKSLFVVTADGSLVLDMQFKDAAGTTQVFKTDPLCSVSSEYISGFISLNVEAGQKYYVFCNASRPRIAGYIFSPDPITIDPATMADVKSVLNTEPYAVLDGTTLYFYYDDQKSARGGMDIGPFASSSDRGWDGYVENIKSVEFDQSFSNCTSITSTALWFVNCYQLETITNLNYLNTENVTSMKEMFSDCSGLTSLDVSNFNTGKVTDMYHLFSNCQQVTSLDVKDFNTANVTNMGHMFAGCSELTSLDVRNFNTSNVTDMEQMFYNCSKVTNLDLSNFNTSNVTTMYQMFVNCSGLTRLDLGKFNTSNVTNMGEMFTGCSGLTYLNLSSFNTSQVTYMGGMFNNCSSLTSLDVSNFNTSNVTNMFGLFLGCKQLTTLDLSNFETTKTTDMSVMFASASQLKTIYVGSGWNVSNVRLSDNMFLNCASLVGGAGTVFDENHVDHTYARIDGGTSAPGYFTEKNAANPSTDEHNLYPAKNIVWDDITWKNAHNSRDKDNNYMPFLMGSGLGYKTLLAESFYSEEQGANITRPYYTYVDYEAGETGVPGYGLYYRFTPKTSGQLRFNTWVNKGNRKTFVVKGSTGAALEPYVDYTFDGYVNGQNNITDGVSYPIYFTADEIKARHDESGTVNKYVVDKGNQIFWGWITLNVEAGESYYIYQQTSQLGFGGYDFIPTGGTAESYVSCIRSTTDDTFALSSEFAAVVDENGKATNVTERGSFVRFGTTNMDVEALGSSTPISVEADLDIQPYAVLSDNNTVLTFYYDDQKSARGGMDIGPFAYLEHGFGESQRPWHDVRESIVYAVIDPSMSQYTSLVSTGWWFYGCKNLKSVSGWENLYPLNIVDMWGTFEYCSSLPSDPAAGGPDFSNFYSNSLKRTVAMFHGCTSMTSLDLSALNTSNVTENEGMFEGCTALTTIYVGSGWDMSNATDNWVDNMFSGCTSLVGGAGTRYDANNIGTSYAHIDGGVDNPGYLTELIRKPLTAADYFEWTGMKANATKKSESPYPNCYYILGQSAEIPYGEPDVNPYTYADVSMYDRLEVTATGNTPRILLNRDSVGGQWNEDESLSHMIESTQRGWSSKYFSHSGNVWTVDLKQIVADKGFAHLNAIKGDSWSAVTVIKIELVKINSTATAGNATFDDHLGVLTVEGDLTMQQAVEQAGGRQPIAERIRSIVWNSSVVLTESDLDGFTNPNMLIFVGNKDKTTLTRNNVVIEGKARKVVLSDVASGNGDFWCPQEFFADSIIYTHNYKQATEIGVSRGWETIALPFDVQTITHEKNGVIAPFGSSASDKHFWLRTLVDEQGLARATKIEANHAYLISMPNNGKYPAEYNLAGNVTFATAGVVVPETIYRASQLTTDNGRIILMPNFLRLYASEYYYVLNVGEARGGHPEGSVFEVNYREALPFQAFTYHEGNQNPSRFISLDELMEGTTGIETIEQPQWSGAEQWWSIDGRKLNGKPSQKGVYIRNGKKVVVKATF